MDNKEPATGFGDFLDFGRPTLPDHHTTCEQIWGPQQGKSVTARENFLHLAAAGVSFTIREGR